MKHCLLKPNHLRGSSMQVTPTGNEFYNTLCECSVCTSYFAQHSSNSNSPTNESISQRYRRFAWHIGDFNWFLEQLSCLNEIPISLFLKIPETVIWRNGVPECILKMFGTRVVKVPNPRLSKRFIQRNFNQDEKQMYGLMRISSEKISNLESQRGYKSRSASRETITQEIYKDKYRYIMRVKPHIQDEKHLLSKFPSVLLTDKKMSEVMTKLPSEKLKQLSSFLAYVKKGIKGSPLIRIQHKMPLDRVKEKKKIEKLTPTILKEAQCRKVVEELCRLISEKNGIEILEMKAEFMATDTEKWLQDAWQIVYRIKEKVEEKVEEDPIKYAINESTNSKLLGSLKEHQTKGLRKPELFEDLTSSINKHLQELRESSGLNSTLSPPIPDLSSNKAFEKLRPNCPYRFSDLLSPNFKRSMMFKNTLTPDVPSVPNQEIASCILYDEPIKKHRKLAIPKTDYTQYVTESLRVLHHLFPKQSTSLAHVHNSIAKMQTILTTNKRSEISSPTNTSISTLVTSRPTTQANTTRNPVQLLQFVLKNRHTRISSKVKLINP